MPKVDQKLIDLANELDFVLIQMPSMKNLRYSEVINDVMEYIFNDRTQNESIVTDILARISVLQEGQRTIDTVLRMISDRLLASVELAVAAGAVRETVEIIEMEMFHWHIIQEIQIV